MKNINWWKVASMAMLAAMSKASIMRMVPER